MATPPKATSATQWTESVGNPQLTEAINAAQAMGLPPVYIANVSRGLVDGSYEMMLAQGWPADECLDCKKSMEATAKAEIAKG